MLNLVKLKLLGQSLIDILYPRYCHICLNSISDISYDGVCSACLEKIKIKTTPFCKKCGLTLKSVLNQQAYCSKCRNKQFCFDEALSVSDYSGITKKSIQLFKYRRKIKIGRNLSIIMTRFLKQHFNLNNIDLITAVPLHKIKLKERGFNQAEILANLISINLTIPASFDKLLRHRNTLSQYQMSLKQRQLNIKGAFCCRDKSFFQNKSILIIDDIFTTGATLSECSRILKDAGAKKIYTLTMAR